MRRTSAAVLALAIVLIPTAAAPGKVRVHGSVEQAYVTGAKRGAELTLIRHGRHVARKRAGRLGAAVFRHLEPGRYRLRGKRIRVQPNRSKPPRRALYRQRIPKSGYGYLTTRDGTQLAVNVHLPSGPGPYPTLIEYSGYGYANPAGAESSISAVANLLGFAVVDVNMRGTGCSGGAFDYFEALQGLDGYDVIETVARQPWVLHHKVGMVGVSYGGISQLFVAARRPPRLAAITPLSVIDNTQTTLYPGGILNTGFALSWAKDRVHDARPASRRGGQKWALDRIKAGDRTCKRNQALHAEAVDLLAKVRANNYYRPKVADPLSPATFVHRIKVPVFLACQWTDEQTGGHCPNLAGRFRGTDRKWFTFTNGVHTDSLDPATFNRWYDFMQIYVARRPPRIPDGVKDLAPAIYKALVGIDGVTLPDDPIQSQPTLAAARAAFEAQPPVRILFDNGAGGAPGVPYAGFERSFAGWPVPGTSARSWYLGAAGTLTDAAPTAPGADSFTWDRTARPATDFTGDTGSGGLWTSMPAYDWRPNPPGTALSYTSGPLAATTAVVGSGALYGWIQSSTRDVDLQVTVTEVRPDGHETFVQSGWLRAGLRRLDARASTELQPVLSLRRKHAKPLPRGRFAAIAVPLYYQGHVYRAGSRIRVTIAAPGGDQPVWAFADTRPKGTATVTFAHSPGQPSRLVLPVVAGVAVPTGYPPCPGLRGEPCR
ncbi:MAG TPA: CocE/NonD family hydrolase [Solirubrobacteraceae bacterium]|nr:CocE/NonD family hydrolase [Solirubrobacteraceae bacterium]